MGYINGMNRDQVLLFPERVDGTLRTTPLFGLSMPTSSALISWP
jgi:hypothetical protein